MHICHKHTRSSRLKVLTALSLVLLTTSAAMAAAPQKIMYQGTLRRANSPYTGDVTFVFRITDASGGTEYWTSGSTVVALSGGMFRYPLGETNTGGDGGFPSINWAGITPYVEVTSDGTTLLPREPLASVPYALSTSGDNLGTHVATTTLDMNGQSIVNTASGTFTQGITASSATFGNAKISRFSTQANDTGITLTTADFGKTITVDSATDQIVTLPSVGAGDIGGWYTIVKLGSGKVTIQAAASTYIADSGAGGTIYNSSASGEYYANVTLRLAASTKWIIIGGDGLWTTTN